MGYSSVFLRFVTLKVSEDSVVKWMVLVPCCWIPCMLRSIHFLTAVGTGLSSFTAGPSLQNYSLPGGTSPGKASQVAQWVNSLLAMQEMQETRVQARVRKIPWRRAWKPTPVFLPGESHGQRSLVGYSPQGHKVRHDWGNWAHMLAPHQEVHTPISNTAPPV